MIFRLIPIPWQDVQAYILLYSPYRCTTPNSSISHSTVFLMIIDLLLFNNLSLKTTSALVILIAPAVIVYYLNEKHQYAVCS